MTVKDLLAGKPKSVITTRPDTIVEQAMGQLLQHKISCLPVVDDNLRLMGIIAEKDIFRCAYESGDDFRKKQVSELMTVDLIVGVPDDSIGYMAGLMTQNRIRHIPIVQGESLVGLVSVGDIVKTQMENMQIENRYLKQYIEGGYPG
jgi:CBS domain-containing protein